MADSSRGTAQIENHTMTPKIPIKTIGYGKRSLEEFLEVLKQHGVEYLIDVRSVPFSRYKPQFSKPALSKFLDEHDIRYVFMGDTLGGRPEDPSLWNAEGNVDYSKVRKNGVFRSGIDRLCKAIQQRKSVVVMCSEGKPEECHRSRLIGEALVCDRDVETVHIDENNISVPHHEIIERVPRRERQGLLFPEIDGIPLEGGFRSTDRLKK